MLNVSKVVNYSGYSRTINSELNRKVSLSHFPARIFSSNLNSLFFGKFPQLFMCFLSKLWVQFFPMPTFIRHILVIIRNRTNEQMVRINTSWIITMMKNAKTLWNKTIRQYVRNSMRSTVFAFIPRNTISPNTFRSNPFPTIIWRILINFSPKALFNWDWSQSTIFVSHVPIITWNNNERKV